MQAGLYVYSDKYTNAKLCNLHTHARWSFPNACVPRVIKQGQDFNRGSNMLVAQSLMIISGSMIDGSCPVRENNRTIVDVNTSFLIAFETANTSYLVVWFISIDILNKKLGSLPLSLSHFRIVLSYRLQSYVKYFHRSPFFGGNESET